MFNSKNVRSAFVKFTGFVHLSCDRPMFRLNCNQILSINDSKSKVAESIKLLPRPLLILPIVTMKCHLARFEIPYTDTILNGLYKVFHTGA